MPSIDLAKIAEYFYTDRDVRYVPNHANGDPSHKDCENGKVSSVRGHVVFVKYGHGDTAQATDYTNLI